MSARPQSPHERCTALDVAGESYWIEPRHLHRPIAGDPAIMWDVLQHGPEWVEIARAGEAAPMWVRWQDLGPFQIVES
jgi:hypothetical protein